MGGRSYSYTITIMDIIFILTIIIIINIIFAEWVVTMQTIVCGNPDTDHRTQQDLLHCIYRVTNTDLKEKIMRNEKPKLDTKELFDTIHEQVTDKSAIPKEKKKNKHVDETSTAAPKVKKTKSEKGDKKMVVTKDQKAPKEDKLTKFLVSMKKSVRKSIKKEAAEVGISMNEYIVLAVEERLSQDSLDLTKHS